MQLLDWNQKAEENLGRAYVWPSGRPLNKK